MAGMNAEDMASSMGGGGRKPRRPDPVKPIDRVGTRTRLEEFYTRYGLEDKIDGIDGALDKWNDRGEYALFRALRKKYQATIDEVDAAEEGKEEL